MRKLTFSLVLALVLWCSSASAQGLFGCTAGTSGTADPHEMLKTRPAAPNPSPTGVTVEEMLKWPVPTGQATSGGDARETQVFTVSGFVRSVSVSAEDCDLRLEIASTQSADAPRIIAEIPMTQLEVQQEAASALGVTEQNRNRTFEANEAPRVVVTGYGFYDKDRGPSDASADVKSQWELHPVWKFAAMRQEK